MRAPRVNRAHMPTSRARSRCALLRGQLEGATRGEDGTCADRAAGLSFPALGRRPRRAAQGTVHENATPVPSMRTVPVVTSTDGTPCCHSPAMHPAPGALRHAVAAATVALLATAVGCAPQPEEKAAATPSGSAAKTCAKGELATKTSGKLAIATDEPAYDPWFED